MAELCLRHDAKLNEMKTEMRQMYLDMSAECKVKDSVIDSLSNKLKSCESEISKMFKMLHYPRMVKEM